jgi:hypothetical protein
MTSSRRPLHPLLLARASGPRGSPAAAQRVDRESGRHRAHGRLTARAKSRLSNGLERVPPGQDVVGRREITAPPPAGGYGCTTPPSLNPTIALRPSIPGVAGEFTRIGDSPATGAEG